jgi:hypothetical protein
LLPNSPIFVAASTAQHLLLCNSLIFVAASTAQHLLLADIVAATKFQPALPKKQLSPIFAHLTGITDNQHLGPILQTFLQP